MPYIAPRTLTTAEQELILRVTAGHPRDHAIISMALGTGLRLGEIVGLNVGDVFFPDGAPRQRVAIRREIAKNGRAGDVFLPDRLIPKLRRLWAFKAERGERLSAADALFCSQSRTRVSKRRVQVAWHAWQRKAGIDPPYSFHCLQCRSECTATS
jgi:integrase